MLELISKHSFDCICIQETIKSSFKQTELERFAGHRDCVGHAGGLLMGVDKDLADKSDEELGQFYQSCVLTMKADGFKWKLFNIYGPAHDERRLEFLEEIQQKVQSSEFPVLLGRDFNMVRTVEEKSNGNVDFHFTDAFNDMINATALRELQRTGSRFTWTNKQIPPTMCVLDRVLVSNAWEDKFNLASVLTGSRLGSDHNPLIMDTGDSLTHFQHYFRFSSHWLRQDGFHAWVLDKWPSIYKHVVLDHWHIILGKLRRAIKGWGQNVDSQQKRIKQQLLGSIAQLDNCSDLRTQLQRNGKRDMNWKGVCNIF